MNRMKQRTLPYIVLLGYLLGCHQGRIALWKDANPNPVQVFPYHITFLPAADQQLLMEGIYASNELELAQLLEDYLS